MTELPRFDDALITQLQHAAPALAAPEAAPARSRRPRPRLALTATLACVVAGLAVLAVALRGGTTAPPANAETLLQDTARAADTAPAGRYTYTRWVSLQRPGLGRAVRFVDERWVDASGRGVSRLRIDNGPAERTRLTGGAVLSGVRVTRGALARVADDPDALSALLAQAARKIPGLPTAQARRLAAFRVLADALTSGTPGPVRAALLERVAQLPGLTRAGTRVSTVIGDVRFALTLDPARGTATRIERRLLRRSAQFPGPPRVLSTARLEASGVRARLP